jgi:hypothetical protein
MTSVITGDIINSRGIDKPIRWIKPLKAVLNKLGKEPRDWEIFRGDSFQLEIRDVHQVLMAAIRIKATIKCTKNLDVRMAIGIGEKKYRSQKITQANGEAFIYSGELFERLKKNTLAIRSPWKEVDNQINLLLELALLTMDHWTPRSAEIVRLSMEIPEATQKEIGKKLGITQGRVSERQKRAGYDEVMKMEQRFRELINEKIQ